MTGRQSDDDARSALRYVLSNVDDARAALDRASSALATATAYGRIVIARNNDDEAGDES
ncbi:MAG: hypothetical protein ACRDPQ_03560 [Nocardioidaceae bacterium]